MTLYTGEMNEIKGLVQNGHILLFGPILISFGIKLIFGRQTRSDMKNYCSIIIVFVDLCFIFKKSRIREKNRFVKGETKETFCFIIIHIITLISYCCFNCWHKRIRRSRARFEFVLLWPQFNTWFIIFFFHGLFQFLLLSKTKTSGDARYTKSIYALLSRPIVWSLLCYCVRNRDHCCVLCDITRDLLLTWYIVHQPKHLLVKAARSSHSRSRRVIDTHLHRIHC